MVQLDPDYWNRKGNEFARKNLYEEAIDCYNYAILQDKDYFQAWHNKGIILKRTGRIEDSRYCLEVAERLKNRAPGEPKLPSPEPNPKSAAAITVPDAWKKNPIGDKPAFVISPLLMKFVLIFAWLLLSGGPMGIMLRPLVSVIIGILMICVWILLKRIYFQKRKTGPAQKTTSLGQSETVSNPILNRNISEK
jgi:tetratricopeptide (TPR) repeat protein